MAAHNHSRTANRKQPGTSDVDVRSRHRVRTTPRQVRVLLAVDLGLVRGAMAALLASVPDIEVVGQHQCGPKVIADALELRPDVVVVDVDLTSPRGMETLRQLGDRLPDCRVLALATVARPGAVRGALDAHALGALDKDASPEHLRDSIRRVATGARYIDENLAVAALSVTSNPLTARELSVLRLAAEGASALEIADELSLSCGTVRNYLSRAVTKTGARSRIDAIRIAREAAWL